MTPGTLVRCAADGFSSPGLRAKPLFHLASAANRPSIDRGTACRRPPKAGGLRGEPFRGAFFVLEGCYAGNPDLTHHPPTNREFLEVPLSL